MAVNVTEKDKTLNTIIHFCEEAMNIRCRSEGAHARGYREALTDVIAHCRDNLGYSGVMPLEAPCKEPETETTKKSEDVNDDRRTA